MMQAPLRSGADIEAECRRIEGDGFCASFFDLVRNALPLLSPPETISTTECARKYRYLRNPEGTGKRLWSLDLTPYIAGIQAALDDPAVRDVYVMGPARTGKSVAGENHLFKRLRVGPLTDTLIYLPGDGDVKSYIENTFEPFFELHPEIAARIGPSRSDNKKNLKRVGGRLVEVLPANGNTVRQRQAPFIIATEIDGYKPSLRNNFPQQVRIRGRTFGNTRKAYIESHADVGWSGGIAAAWRESSKGLFYWPCPDCGGWSCPHPLGARGMVMKLYVNRTPTDAKGNPVELEDNALLDWVAEHAGAECPHCGSILPDTAKPGMLLAGKWVFEGEVIAVDGTVSGTARPNTAQGFALHGLMSPWISWGELAKEYVGALVYFERTRKPERLKEITVKSFGEVYEGAGEGSRALDPVKLRERAAADDETDGGFETMTVPPGVLFVTAAVDVGARKFDTIFVGWDLEGRSWIIGRDTVRQNAAGQEVRPPERQKDWLVIRDLILRRVIPFAEDPAIGIPVAAVAIDTGGSEGVTWKAREFARAMIRDGESGRHGYRVRLIKGAKAAAAPEVGNPRKVSKDDHGNVVAPIVSEFDLGVHRLKSLTLERLALEEDGPGYVRFASDLPQSAYAEFANEVLIDGKWERRGDNESLDLFGYAEAARILLGPDRKDINWERPPEWARPVQIEMADAPPASSGTSAPAKARRDKRSVFERFDALNSTEGR